LGSFEPDLQRHVEKDWTLERLRLRDHTQQAYHHGQDERPELGLNLLESCFSYGHYRGSRQMAPPMNPDDGKAKNFQHEAYDIITLPCTIGR
jgi:hypothetical protein